MKAFIWMEVQCSNCNNVIEWDYTNARSVSALKKKLQKIGFLIKTSGTYAQNVRKKLRGKQNE